jgi:hypothetical protein
MVATLAELPAALAQNGRVHPSTRGRLMLSGAVWGPGAFIAAWGAAGLMSEGYSPIRQHISELAAVGAPTRPLMNTGFAAFACGVGMAAWPLRRLIGGRAATAAGVSAASTFAVLLTPLGASPQTDALHSAFAFTGYVSLAAVGPLAAPHVTGRLPLAGAVSVGAGVMTAACLGLSLGGPAPGLFQRLGLGVTDLWLASVAIASLAGARRR